MDALVKLLILDKESNQEKWIDLSIDDLNKDLFILDFEMYLRELVFELDDDDEYHFTIKSIELDLYNNLELNELQSVMNRIYSIMSYER